MTRRETDTSASEATSDAVESASASAEASATTGEADEASAEAGVASDEREALFDVLVEEGVLAVGEDGGVRTTDEFDDTRAIYHDSYVGVSEAEFHESVAATFGLPDADERSSSSNQPSADDAESTADLVAEHGVSRGEFVCYLAVRSHLDGADPRSADDLSTADLVAMAGMVWAVVPDSPVPPEVADVTDDPGSFVAERDRAVVTVWKRFCDPCDSLKADLAAVLDGIPDGVPVAGVDGEAATDFCERYAVESAPGFVLFGDGDHRTVSSSDPDEVVEALRSVFGDGD